MSNDNSVVLSTFEYIFNSDNRDVLLSFADNEEQENALSLFYDFLGINCAALMTALDKTLSIRERRISYLEILFNFSPQIQRAVEIMVSFCSECSIIKNRNNIINYFHSCYDFIDYSSAIRFYNSIMLHYYNTTGLIEFYSDDNSNYIFFNKGTGKEDLKKFINDNWELINRNEKDISWRMNPKILRKVFAEYLIYNNFPPKTILKILDLIFNEKNGLTAQMDTILTEEDIRIYKHRLKKSLAEDWFNLAYQHIKKVKLNESEKYYKMIDDGNAYNLSFDAKTKVFCLQNNCQ